MNGRAHREKVLRVDVDDHALEAEAASCGKNLFLVWYCLIAKQETHTEFAL